MIYFFSTIINAQNEFKNLWNQVHQFEVNNLPKSASKIVHKIYNNSKKQNNSTQLIKALFYKSKFLLVLEEDAQLKVIEEFKQHINSSKSPTKNILENVLANLYWQYFNQNRWRFYNRTQTNAKVDKNDFRTWDLTTLFHEIHKHFKASLLNESELQKISISEFSSILQITKDTKLLQPTLFDFLAYNSLAFYKSSETAITHPTYEFKIDNENYIDIAFNFSKLKLTAKDSLSLQLNALKTYQKLIQLHIRKNNLAALVNYDIERLAFINKYGTYKNKQELLLKVLRASKKYFKNYEESGLYAFEIAKIFKKLANTFQPKKYTTHQFKSQEALLICEDIINKFPKSIGAKKCTSLKNNITRTELNITTEKHIPILKFARVLVKYKNISKLHFYIHKINSDQIEQLSNIYNSEKQYDFLTRLPEVRSWSSNLKSEADYQKHTTEIGIPKLKAGNYVIIATPEKGFNKNSSFAFANTQVTNIAFILNHQQNSNYQIVDRNTGVPLVNAKVNFSNKGSNHHNKSINENFITDRNGEFTFVPNRKHFFNVKATINYKVDNATFRNLYIKPTQKKSINTNHAYTKTFLFTDRSIYRPGQTIYFKGISLETLKNTSTVIAHKTVKVSLKDANYQLVKEIELKTNEFGSFTSSFIIPSQGLTGQFIIETSIDGQRNNSYISVEEYKRPKFKVAFKPITKALKVRDKISVNGFAESYARTSVSDAKVTYRVQRKVLFPKWWYFYRPYFTSSPKEIIQGETTTDRFGNFYITFNAIPDNDIDKETQPIFTYEISAEITDVNGETRGATTEIKVGYHALLANIELPEDIDKTTNKAVVTISTKNLNGEDLKNLGSIEIFKLKAPEQVLRKRPWKAPDYQIISKKEFRNKYPHDAYTNEDNYLNWKKGKRIFFSEYNTGKSKEIVIKGLKKWDSGKYIAILKTKDTLNQDIEARQFFVISSKQDIRPMDQQLLTISTDKKNYEIGDSAIISVKSNSDDMSLVMLIEKDHQIYAKHYISLNKNQKKFSVPIKNEFLGGFGIKWYFVNYNSFEKGHLNVRVPYPKTDLEISTNTFRDRLKPGGKETWKFTIKDPKKEKSATELLAAMYDASLDAFKPHQWNFSPIKKNIYQSYNKSDATVSFGNTNFKIINSDRAKKLNYNPYYTKFNWFGLNLNHSQWTQKQYLRNLKFQRTEFDAIIFGIVKGEFGPLPGTSVQIKGTTYGTVTDLNGKFSLKINKGDLLVFRSIGMKQIEKKVENTNNISIFMESDDQAENELLMISYGSQRDAPKMSRTAESAMVTTSINKNQQEYESDEETKEKIVTNTQKNVQKYNEFDNVHIRKNFRETTFFYPQLVTDSEGTISFNFTVPETLTKWKLQLLAHNKKLHSATKILEVITQKELMVTTNPPRFLRQGDKITMSTKISNLSGKDLKGTVKLILVNPISGKEINILENSKQEQSFAVEKDGNSKVSWNLSIPENIEAIQYKVIAKAGKFSDGEQNTLLVLSNRLLITETLPMWIRSKETKTFNLEKLKNNTSQSLKHHQLTLEVTSNPAWYAVQSLSHLMEYMNECSEQIFAGYYANTLASFIINSNPKIKEVFNQWKTSDVLLSNLEKNQKLKSLIIQETPWLRYARSETEQKKRIALLFDLNMLGNKQQSAILQLKNMQLANGGFPWFKKGVYPNPYITLHIASGFGHLKKLGISNFNDITDELVKKTIRFLDKEIIDRHQELLSKADRIKAENGKEKYTTFLKKNHLNNFILQYLYMRSFYPNIKTNSNTKKAILFYTKQSSKFWREESLYGKGLIALINHRNGQKVIASKIIKSLKENSILSEEMGMYWKVNKPSWNWYEAPIETQALLIEAFTEIENDAKTIDHLKVWLLKNKQVNQWKTSKATTEAIYALLLQGSNWLSSMELTNVSVGKKVINPKQNPDIKLEAGTGYYKTSWEASSIEKNMGTVTMNSNSETIAWGALYWQYFEEIDKVSASKTPLQVNKKVFKKINTNTGKKLLEISNKTPLKVGDLLTVRMELRSDRDMQFIHIKDMRASGLEPVSTLSKYKWQDGLGYYQSIKDASTNFFFSRLPKGVYIFEYDVRANNAGNFSNGITRIQSMYAPEFSSHSSGIKLSIKE